VEVDETYVGGKPRKMSKQTRERMLAEGKEIPKPKRGLGRGHHVPVVERSGRCARAWWRTSPKTTSRRF
jgi:hypothetical protein